ncbi:MAG: hypothetical protein U0W40_13500 [Acidimicrobiia bacterium]
MPGAFYTEAAGLTVVFTIDNDHLEEIAVGDGEGGGADPPHAHEGHPAPGPEPKTGKVVLIAGDVVAPDAAARQPAPPNGNPRSTWARATPSAWCATTATFVEMIQTS